MEREELNKILNKLVMVNVELERMIAPKSDIEKLIAEIKKMLNEKYSSIS